MSERTQLLVVIPARGGSKGIPRKNLRTLAGNPLISYAIRMAQGSRYAPTVVVTSDDDEILSVAAKYGALTHRRPSVLGADEVTLDAVIHDALLATPGAFDLVATVQPTSPLMRSMTFDEAVDRIIREPDIDTVLSGVDDRHLRWKRDADGRLVPDYAERVNRQQLPPMYRETGGFLITRTKWVRPDSRIGESVVLALISGPEAIDIDSADDFALCDWHLSRRHLLFVVTGHPSVGLGHVFNTLTVANDLMRYELTFLVDRESELAERVIAERNYPVHRQRGDDLAQEALALEPSVVINDRLDTSRAYLERLKSKVSTVINFEDLGPGAELADLVINAIYPESVPRAGHYYGPRYFCLRPEFVLTQPRPVNPVVERVLVTFGGTDPNDFTDRVSRLIAPECSKRGIELTVILGMGYGHRREPVADRLLRSVADMADEMRRADLVFTSAGRTVFEVASVGTPAIVLAQNEREMSHTFASEKNGFVNLGLGSDVPDEEIVEVFCHLVDDEARRSEMQRQMLETDLKKGVQRVVGLIEQAIKANEAS